MNNLKIGHVINEDQERDAIHVAVFPAQAAHPLRPGDHVGLRKGLASTLSKTFLGIVDPFLKKNLEKGEKFWIFLYPNSVTSLRHTWSHPELDSELAAAKEVSKNESKEASKTWLLNYISSNCPYYVENGSDGYDAFMSNIADGYIHYSGSDLHSIEECNEPELLMAHLSILLDRVVTIDQFRFSCSC